MKSGKKQFLPILIICVAVVLSIVILIIGFTGNSKNASKLPEYTVNFFDNNGKVLSTAQVEENGFAVPPETLECEGYIFGGWEGSFNRVLSNTDCNPSLKAIGDDKNVIYANAHYAAANSEITVDIKLGGDVELDELEFSGEFDPDVWKAKKITSKSGETDINGDKITYKLNDNKKLKSGDTLATVHFKVGRKQFLYNELVFSIKTALYINNGVSSNADYSVINGKIYTY